MSEIEGIKDSERAAIMSAIRGGFGVASILNEGRHLASTDEIITAYDARLNAALSRNKELEDEKAALLEECSKLHDAFCAAADKSKVLEEALEPFADAAFETVGDDGWIEDSASNRLDDWFSPSEFRAARTAMNGGAWKEDG